MTVRHTASSNAAAIADLNLRFDRLEALIVGMAAEQPAKTVRKAPAKKAPAKAAQATSDRLAGGQGPKVAAPARKCLCKSTRLAFIAAAVAEGVDLTGWSARNIAIHCVETSWAPKGFMIGERYTVMAQEALAAR